MDVDPIALPAGLFSDADLDLSWLDSLDQEPACGAAGHRKSLASPAPALDDKDFTPPLQQEAPSAPSPQRDCATLTPAWARPAGLQEPPSVPGRSRWGSREGTTATSAQVWHPPPASAAAAAVQPRPWAAPVLAAASQPAQLPALPGVPATTSLSLGHEGPGSVGCVAVGEEQQRLLLLLRYRQLRLLLAKRRVLQTQQDHQADPKAQCVLAREIECPAQQIMWAYTPGTGLDTQGSSMVAGPGTSGSLHPLEQAAVTTNAALCQPAGALAAIHCPDPPRLKRQHHQQQQQEPHTQALQGTAEEPQPQDSSIIAERRRENARRSRKRKADHLAAVEHENDVLRAEVVRLHCTLRAWAMQGFVTPDQALDYLAGVQVDPPQLTLPSSAYAHGAAEPGMT
ncbi:hypothetical protein N2152v2_000797 [Parachlorella kessleri]